MHTPLLVLKNSVYFSLRKKRSVKNENLTFTESLPGALALVAGSVILAYLCLKLYDEPVRRFLTDRFLRREK